MRQFLFFLCLLSLGNFIAVSSMATTQTSEESWREQYAYALGVTAYHYTYPYLRMAQVRWDWTRPDRPHPEVVPRLKPNTFWHASKLVNANWREGGAPNNDTLYSAAWLYVKNEPIILSVPAMDRYFTFEVVNFDSDNFTYVGERTTGREGGHYAFLPRGWTGKLPKGVTSLGEVPAPWILLAGRTYVAGQEDLPAVFAIQQQYQLTPLSQWGQESVSIAEVDVFQPYDKTVDPLAEWKTINRALAENPPLGKKAAILDMFTEIGIGPGLDIEQLDEATKRGLARAAKDAFQQIQKAQMEGAGAKMNTDNGWRYSVDMGRAGDAGDFFTRSVHQSYAGIVANDPEEAIYYGGFVGSDKQPLSGDKKYRIRMPAGTEPEVEAFWSVTLYDTTANMAANEINRYSIGDRTPGLQRDAEGGLTLYLQKESPDEDKLGNWLPTPEGRFWLVLRAYLPSEKMISNQWALPVIEVVN